ncbi:Uncharacterised protein [Mycobacteroides abscessus subsp. abscessus]|nr:Uncharacterised protein [Mycobacteroides abscessus subsp. abscessus]
MVDAPRTETWYDELIPASSNHLLTGTTAHSATEHRVVPVHRVLGRLLENLWPALECVAQRLAGAYPLVVGLLHLHRDAHRAVERLKDAGIPRDQRLVEHGAGRVIARPTEGAVGPLETQDEVDRRPHDRPHAFQEHDVTGDLVVMPHADGDVGAEIGVGAVVGHDTRVEAQRPRPVVALRVQTPAVRGLRFRVKTGDTQRHCRFDMIPGVGASAGEPRQRAGILLHGGDGGAGGTHLLTGHNTGNGERTDVRLCGHRPGDGSTTLDGGVTTPRSPASADTTRPTCRSQG